MEGQGDVHALDLVLAVQVQRVGDHPPAAVAGVGVPDVILLTEDVLAGELFHVLDLEVIPGLEAEVVLDPSPFVCWRLHDVKHASGHGRQSPRRWLPLSSQPPAGWQHDRERAG
jgi:hypothetical protein